MKPVTPLRVFAPRNGLCRRRMLLFWFCCFVAPAFPQQIVPPPDQTATISGTVIDPNGNFIPSASIHLKQGESKVVETQSDTEGHFFFFAVPPGPFQVTIVADGFTRTEVTGDLHPAEKLALPPVSLAIPAATTEVRVSVSTYELAEEQVKIEETQRVLGVIPNYFVTYQQDTLPLKAKQKFELAWKTTIDPVTFAAAGAFAGIEQAENTYSGYGQGGKGFAKRYGASYGDAFIGIMVGRCDLAGVVQTGSTLLL